ncbi:MAG: hypothetical protein VYD64_07325 [Pseudomonadota bacterium]|nr:hypothetical protein [Pseudomonadota bacterium]
MQFLGNLIVRAVPVLLGLVLAFVAAGLFLGFGFYAEVVDPVFDVDPRIRHDGVIVLLTGLAWSPFIAAAAMGPALVIIAVAEVLKLRGLVTNTLAGGMVALFVYWAGHGSADPSGSAGRSLSDGALIVLLATGFIGGLVYWLIAGRSAGKWLEKPAIS